MLNNADFSRLLVSNDAELVKQLTQPAKKKKKDGDRERGKGKGKPSEGRPVGGGAGELKEKGKGKGEGRGKGQGKGKEDASGITAKPGPAQPVYRDRAKERREEQEEYAQIAAEWDGHAEVSIDQSKYLGGDLEHTHLVKGLDYALLSKVRTELSKHEKAYSLQQQRLERKQNKKAKRTFESNVARHVWHAVVETLHPHHTLFRERLRKMGQALAMGQRIRGAPSVFLPGRTSYVFDTDVEPSKNDIPRIVYSSKEEAPSVDWSKKVTHIETRTIERVRDALHEAAEQRRQRKRDRTRGAEPAAYAVAQKVSITRPGHRAKDADEDIFQGAGGFDTEAVIQKAMEEKARRGEKEAPKKSFFDDVGRSLEAPDGQLDLADIEVDNGRPEEVAAPDASDTKVAFRAADRFEGARLGWVFKLGAQGLGYYKEARELAKGGTAVTAGGGPTRHERAEPRGGPPKTARGLLAPAADENEDAYGECFPMAMLSHAGMTTGDASDEEEDGKKKRGKEDTDQTEPSKDSGRKNAEQRAQNEAKKRKQKDGQEWQKIESMIAKKKHRSVDEIEAEALAMRPKRSDPPGARQVQTFATPSFF